MSSKRGKDRAKEAKGKGFRAEILAHLPQIVVLTGVCYVSSSCIVLCAYMAQV